jgi:hypothetical protein
MCLPGRGLGAGSYACAAAWSPCTLDKNLSVPRHHRVVDGQSSSSDARVGLGVVSYDDIEGRCTPICRLCVSEELWVLNATRPARVCAQVCASSRCKSTNPRPD